MRPARILWRTMTVLNVLGLVVNATVGDWGWATVSALGAYCSHNLARQA